MNMARPSGTAQITVVEIKLKVIEGVRSPEWTPLRDYRAGAEERGRAVSLGQSPPRALEVWHVIVWGWTKVAPLIGIGKMQGMSRQRAQDDTARGMREEEVREERHCGSFACFPSCASVLHQKKIEF